MPTAHNVEKPIMSEPDLIADSSSKASSSLLGYWCHLVQWLWLSYPLSTITAISLDMAVVTILTSLTIVVSAFWSISVLTSVLSYLTSSSCGWESCWLWNLLGQLKWLVLLHLQREPYQFLRHHLWGQLSLGLLQPTWILLNHHPLHLLALHNFFWINVDDGDQFSSQKKITKKIKRKQQHLWWSFFEWKPSAEKKPTDAILVDWLMP